jgi:hypothetical protein
LFLSTVIRNWRERRSRFADRERAPLLRVVDSGGCHRHGTEARSAWAVVGVDDLRQNFPILVLDPSRHPVIVFLPVMGCALAGVVSIPTTTD